MHNSWPDGFHVGVFSLFQSPGYELENSETVVMCELCHAHTINFNRHMRTHHPGCGGKNEPTPHPVCSYYSEEAYCIPCTQQSKWSLL